MVKIWNWKKLNKVLPQNYKQQKEITSMAGLSKQLKML